VGGKAAAMLEVSLLPLSPKVEPAVLELDNAHATKLSWPWDWLTLLLRQALGTISSFAMLIAIRRI
jgi:hypothetical protein